MKNIIITLLMLVAIKNYGQEKGKQVVTSTFKVAGNCEQCKSRIENAVDIKGVKTSTWDAKTQTLKVIYRADKVSEQQIQEAILKSGHDLEGKKAADANYNKLPECCKYRDHKHE